MEYASTYYLLRRSTPNHKHSNKPRHPECFIENLAVAEVANLAVAAVVLNIERNDTVFARIRCFIVYPVRPYPGIFGLLARTGKGGVSTRYSTFSLLAARSSYRWSSSYNRTVTMLVHTGQSEYRKPGPRDTGSS